MVPGFPVFFDGQVPGPGADEIIHHRVWPFMSMTGNSRITRSRALRP
jgi:hypothetical protein